MATLKVTVTGMVNETFVGNDKEVEKYLLNLKKIQDEKVSIEDMKAYRKEMPLYKERHLVNGDCGRNRAKYHNPSNELEAFREKTKPHGLSIKIERHIPKTDKFF